MPSPLPRRQFAVQAVFLLLHEHARTSGGVALAAPLDVVFDEYDVLQPDVLFFRAERRLSGDSENCPPGDIEN